MNGWTNRETWLVNLWCGDWLMEDTDFFHSPEELEELVKSCADVDADVEIEAGLISDFISGCWAEVNWQELYDHYKEDE